MDLQQRFINTIGPGFTRTYSGIYKTPLQVQQMPLLISLSHLPPLSSFHCFLFLSFFLSSSSGHTLGPKFFFFFSSSLQRNSSFFLFFFSVASFFSFSFFLSLFLHLFTPIFSHAAYPTTLSPTIYAGQPFLFPSPYLSLSLSLSLSLLFFFFFLFFVSRTSVIYLFIFGSFLFGL